MTRSGIIGPGAIAAQFVEAMTLVDGSEIIPVSSRSPERAVEFAARFGIPRSYGYDGSLVADAAVDAIHVATPHARRESGTIAALAAGKHVLCAKPLALNAKQAVQRAQEARSRGLFLMEALWSRCPTERSLMSLPTKRSVSRSSSRPTSPSASRRSQRTGSSTWHWVAARCSISAVQVTGSSTARISGVDGSIEVPAFMHCPQWLVVNGERIDTPYENGLQFEIDEVHRCVGDGRTESAVVPLDESIAVAATLDELRAQVGVVHPGDAA